MVRFWLSQARPWCPKLEPFNKLSAKMCQMRLPGDLEVSDTECKERRHAKQAQGKTIACTWKRYEKMDFAYNKHGLFWLTGFSAKNQL
jgi:hypothetical protein